VDGPADGIVDGVVATLVDLVLPGGCAGCGVSSRSAVCPDCALELRRTPELHRPRPLPPGLPPCLAGGDYAGPVREMLLAYKERGRRGLAAPLGDRLGAVVRAGWVGEAWAGQGYRVGDAPVALVPVPGTAAAIRSRHGDHMVRLAQQAVRFLDRSGVAAAVASPLRALPKKDSSHLDRDQRAAAARTAFAVRSGLFSHVRLEALRAVADQGAVVLVDDILTTGATLAAVAGVLRDAGIPVAFAATIVATRLHG